MATIQHTAHPELRHPTGRLLLHPVFRRLTTFDLSAPAREQAKRAGERLPVPAGWRFATSR